MVFTLQEGGVFRISNAPEEQLKSSDTWNGLSIQKKILLLKKTKLAYYSVQIKMKPPQGSGFFLWEPSLFKHVLNKAINRSLI